MSTLPQPPPDLPPAMPTAVAPLSLPLRIFRVILWFLPLGFLVVSAWVTKSIGRAGYNDLAGWRGPSGKAEEGAYCSDGDLFRRAGRPHGGADSPDRRRRAVCALRGDVETLRGGGKECAVRNES